MLQLSDPPPVRDFVLASVGAESIVHDLSPESDVDRTRTKGLVTSNPRLHADHVRGPPPFDVATPA